ncbi:DEAD/DEAH box helicase [Actinoplanes sp. NPDC051851]|uniref:DEAD/DEAH box helicase n=1 Tax=Actinoplanes sp. NPDC051851 TaxID=3154753 RepID=UPI00343B2DD2
MQRDLSAAAPQPGGAPGTPRFHGLFIGIDRCRSERIDHLTSASRDATALHAIFSDNLDDSGTLLTDADATSESIRTALIELRSCSTPDDVVVVTFAGHGSDTHRIVTYDADPDDLATTAISLEEFTDLACAVPARLLLVVLDCCFSGAALRKLNTDMRPRTVSADGPDLTTSLLSKVTGKARIVLTASSAEQRAWESRRIGHGLLTHSLLTALLDTAGIAADGLFDLRDLLKNVTELVRANASGAGGVRQDPMQGMVLEGTVRWPVFTRGERFDHLFPPTSPTPVTDDIRSLSGHGIPEALLAGWPAGLRLNQLQQDAVNAAGLLRGNNLLVMAPTSAGKTLIGEMGALHATRTGGRAVFLLPTKALVNEQYREFSRMYGPAGIRLVRATGDNSDQVPALLRGQFDIAVCTYEKFSGLALLHEHLLRLVTVVVIDEIQTIVDPERGPSLELLLTLIKARRENGARPQLIALSAVLGELGGLDSWLQAELLIRTDRPVPLDEGLLDRHGWYRYRDGTGTEHREKLLDADHGAVNGRALLTPLVDKLVTDGQQVLVVGNTRSGVRNAARELADRMALPAAVSALEELPIGDQNLTNTELRSCLAGGVAFHSTELDHEERHVIEEHFGRPDSSIRVVVSTTTLAQGVNLPAETVIIAELHRPVGRSNTAWYAVAEYKNIAGRAGRLGRTDHGRSIALSHSPADDDTLWRRFITGALESVRSALLGPDPDVETAVLRTVAITTVRAEGHDVAHDDVIGVLTQSLAAHQARLRGSPDVFEPARVAEALTMLLGAEFAAETEPGRLRLTRLGAVVAGGGMSVRSALRVSQTLRITPADQLNPATLITVLQLAKELDQLRLPLASGKIRRTETSTRVRSLAQQGAAGVVLEAIRPPATDERVVAMRVARAVALLLWINGTSSGELERFLTDGLSDHHAIGPVRAVASRAHDLVETVLGIAAELHPAADLTTLGRHLPVQLELGIAEVFAPLAICQAGLAREHYLALQAAGFTNPELIARASDEELLKHLGSAGRLTALRTAIDALTAARAVPSLDDLLPGRE